MAFAVATAKGRWRGGYRDGNGKSCWVKGSFPTKPKAIAAAGAAEAEANAPGWRDRSAANRPYEEWVMEWWGSRTVEAKTLKNDLSRMNKHVLPRWSGTALADITRKELKGWAIDLASTPNGRGEDDFGEPLTESNATVKLIVHLLSASLTAALEEGILDFNPAWRLDLPPAAEAVERFLTHGEYQAVRDHLPTELDQLIADTLVETGVRFGELAGAHWHRVNEVNRTWLVAETWHADAERIKAYPKSRKVRPVPVAADLIGRWKDLPRGVTCGKPHQAGRCMSGLLVPSGRLGAPLNVNWWGERVWKPAVDRAGIGFCRVHDLRHTFASWLIQAGFTLAEIGLLLGHVKPETTQRYSHLLLPNHEAVAAAVRREPAVREVPNVVHLFNGA